MSEFKTGQHIKNLKMSSDGIQRPIDRMQGKKFNRFVIFVFQSVFFFKFNFFFGMYE